MDGGLRGLLVSHGSQSGRNSAGAARDARSPDADSRRVPGADPEAVDRPADHRGDITRDTVDQKTPENFAFHLPTTSIPGLGSNTYIYSHARVGMFLNLWNAELGDEVYISTPDLRALKYVVTEVHPVSRRTTFPG